MSTNPSPKRSSSFAQKWIDGMHCDPKPSLRDILGSLAVLMTVVGAIILPALITLPKKDSPKPPVESKESEKLKSSETPSDAH